MKNENSDESQAPVGAASWTLFNEMNFLQDHVKLRKTRMSFEKSIIERVPIIKTDEIEVENVDLHEDEEELITDDQQHADQQQEQQQQQQQSNEDSNQGPQVYAKYTIAKVEGGEGIAVLEGYKDYESNVIIGGETTQDNYERK